jgi:hypothetical protein
MDVGEVGHALVAAPDVTGAAQEKRETLVRVDVSRAAQEKRETSVRVDVPGTTQEKRDTLVMFRGLHKRTEQILKSGCSGATQEIRDT